MSRSDTPAARSAAARDILRLLARLGRRPSGSPSGNIAGAGKRAEPTDEDLGAIDEARRAGWIEREAGATGWKLSGRGREFLRRAMSGQDVEEADAAARAPTPRVSAGPVINPDESVLGWLRRRKGRDGVPLISEEEYQAGERLRADFWFAGLTPRVTSSWHGNLPPGGRRSAPGTGVEIRDEVIAAQSRVRRALAAVGPELSGILVDVCCHAMGLEAAERGSGWPQRSGKVVLQIALRSLARHYGLSQPQGAGSVRRTWHWGAPGYRPGLDEWV